MRYEIYLDSSLKERGSTSSMRYEDGDLRVSLGNTLQSAVDPKVFFLAQVEIFSLGIVVIGADRFYEKIASLLADKKFDEVRAYAGLAALRKMTLNDLSTILEHAREHGIGQGRDEVRSAMRKALDI